MFDPQHKYTVDEYWRLVEAFPEYKYEYIDGDIRLMTGGSPAHAQIAMNIGILLGVALRSQECNVYSSDAALQLTENRLYYPDVSVSCDPADWTRKKALEAPGVVVEVMSPSTEKADKTEKLEAYQRYSTIQEILLVDSRRCQVKHYHRIGTFLWKDALYEQEDDVIDLESIGVSFTVREIYLKVYLELEEVD
ncbi:MAG TPA: Uma2 family endonuclease [Ktedonobacteraceae bacterium]|nr:Uma2 family endonuclease [Ktedonobacteraceae bacterium]